MPVQVEIDRKLV